MRRRTFSRKKPDIELFPFLSILACTIGTLILLIIVLTTQTLNKSQSESNETQEQTEKVEDKSKDQKVKIIAKDEGENGRNKTKNPRYIECREDGIIIYPNKVFVPRENIEDFTSPLQDLITMIELNKQKEYLIIAVRPKGVNVFKRVRNLVEGAEIDIGYEPIDEDWELVTGASIINETQK